MESTPPLDDEQSSSRKIGHGPIGRRRLPLAQGHLGRHHDAARAADADGPRWPCCYSACKIGRRLTAVLSIMGAPGYRSDVYDHLMSTSEAPPQSSDRTPFWRTLARSSAVCSLRTIRLPVAWAASPAAFRPSGMAFAPSIGTSLRPFSIDKRP
jgi:hypothetical protein